MSIINIVIFTIVSIFVLVLFFMPKSTTNASLLYRLASSASPLFFGAQIDDEEKLSDSNEIQFNKDYDTKNKNIASLQKSLDLCSNNRTKLNNAIQKFREELINTVNTTYNTKQKDVNECESTLNSRIQKYVVAYNKRFGTNITNQQVVNKIVNNTLDSK
jgi:septal ring factor EnvC (AmiA/AmiB activator)